MRNGKGMETGDSGGERERESETGRCIMDKLRIQFITCIKRKPKDQLICETELIEPYLKKNSYFENDKLLGFIKVGQIYRKFGENLVDGINYNKMEEN